MFYAGNLLVFGHWSEKGSKEDGAAALLLALALPSCFAALGPGDAGEAAGSLLPWGIPKCCHHGLLCFRGWGMEDTSNMLMLQEEGRKSSFFSV